MRAPKRENRPQSMAAAVVAGATRSIAKTLTLIISITFIPPCSVTSILIQLNKSLLSIRVFVCIDTYVFNGRKGVVSSIATVKVDIKEKAPVRFRGFTGARDIPGGELLKFFSISRSHLISRSWRRSSKKIIQAHSSLLP